MEVKFTVSQLYNDFEICENGVLKILEKTDSKVHINFWDFLNINPNIRNNKRYSFLKKDLEKILIPLEKYSLLSEDLCLDYYDNGICETELGKKVITINENVIKELIKSEHKLMVLNIVYETFCEKVDDQIYRNFLTHIGKKLNLIKKSKYEDIEDIVYDIEGGRYKFKNFLIKKIKGEDFVKMIMEMLKEISNSGELWK